MGAGGGQVGGGVSLECETRLLSRVFMTAGMCKDKWKLLRTDCSVKSNAPVT